MGRGPVRLEAWPQRGMVARSVSLLLTLLFSLAPAAAQTSALRIGVITIRALDVYSADEEAHGRFYRLADKLHVETRTRVIRKFLLFAEGDPLVPARLEETERNLRALPFLKSASVITQTPHDGVVEVIVTTQDAWSLEPESSGGSTGGSGTYGVAVMDNNLIGLGRQLSLGFDHGVDRNRAALDYRDPAFIAPYFRLRLTEARSSDGHEHRLALGRPFFSFSDPWANDFQALDLVRRERLYADGLVSSEFRQEHQELVAAWGVALRPGDARADRIVFGLHAIDDRFGSPLQFQQPDSAALPADRRFRYLFARYTHDTNDFIKLDYIDRDSRYQDFNLGRSFSAEAAISPAALGLPRTTGFLRITDSAGQRVDESSFVLASMAAETRLDRGLENTILSGSARFIRRTGQPWPRATVGRIAFNRGWRLDRDVQFFADGATGLRGYRLHSFEGDRSLLVNLEERVYLGRELLQLVSPAVAVFVDSGFATDRNPWRTAPKTDAGFGLRIGLPRSPRNLLRLDLAYALTPDARGKRGLLISFASGQAF